MESQTKNCQNCKSSFIIEPDDFDFYEKMKVPAPTFCPECRLRRRLAWRNDRGLHKRSCDLCGASIIAMYPEDTQFPVYCRECWFSDKWDALEYGREYDFSKPFFVQFKKLLDVVPQISLQVTNSVNCEYTNQIADCKNCYLILAGSTNEDCAYGYRLLYSKNIIDSLFILRSEYCYECIECMESSRLKFSEDCTDSLDCSFCYDVRGCQNCFMSSNLRNASYVFRNERLPRDEYLLKMKEVDIGSYKNLAIYREEFKKLKLTSLHKFSNYKNVVNFTGHTGSYSKDCYYCFNIANNENCRYCFILNNTKDAMDVNNGCCTMERVYEVSTCGVNASDLKLSADVWPEVERVTYCQSCRNGASDLFGCVGVRGKQYCILNKQYTKEEYETLVPKIITHMNEMPYVDKKGREYKYGEFFPVEFSLYPYNESTAQDFLPLTEEDANVGGFWWRAEKEKMPRIDRQVNTIPDNIDDISDSIANEIIACDHARKCNEHCTVGFKITSSELQYYKKEKIALPRLCPNCRNYQRFKERNPIKLWHRKCMHEGCANEFETSYAPDRPEIVYCESCYNNEVA